MPTPDEIDEWMSRRSTHEAPARNPAAAPTLPVVAPDATDLAPSPAAPSTRVDFDDAGRDAAPAPEEQSPVIAMPRAVRSRAPWRVMLGIAVVLAVAMALPWSPDAGEDALLPDAHDDDMFRVALTPPAGTLVDTLALSPDAQQVLFCGADAGGSRIWVRRVDSIVAGAPERYRRSVLSVLVG
jgi:hypothetical protein